MPDRSKDADAALTAAARTDLDPAVIERQDRQIAELQHLTDKLVETIAGMQAQQARDVVFQDAVAGLKSATNAVLTAPTVMTAAAIPSAVAPAAATAAKPSPKEADCGCAGGACGCVASDCCRFNIYMSYVRCLAMQPLEIEDSNVANPWAELEVQLFAYLEDGTGAVIPSLFSSLTLKKLLSSVGLKVTVDRKIGQVTLSKGAPKTIKIFVDALELDSGLLERLTGGRDEEGQATGTMLLDCCCGGDPSTDFEVNFTSGGQGGGTIGVGFVARRDC